MPLWFIFDEDANFTPAPGAFIALMLLGFLVGIAGHVVKSNTLVATGIGMIFVATLLLPLLLHAL